MCERHHEGFDHSDVAQALDRVAGCLWWLGRGDEALRNLQMSLAMLKRLHGGRDHHLMLRKSSTTWQPCFTLSGASKTRWSCTRRR